MPLNGCAPKWEVLGFVEEIGRTAVEGWPMVGCTRPLHAFLPCWDSSAGHQAMKRCSVIYFCPNPLSDFRFMSVITPWATNSPWR